MAVVNDTTIAAVVRAASAGFTQSWSHDGGQTWSAAINSAVDGAASKPALVSVARQSATSANTRTGADASVSGRLLILAYDVVTRLRMALSTSKDGGTTWRYLATLDNGTDATPNVTEKSTCYPTTIVVGAEILTVWSTYNGGPARTAHVQRNEKESDWFANIKIARVALPTN
jgi:hypothetical protein